MDPEPIRSAEVDDRAACTADSDLLVFAVNAVGGEALVAQDPLRSDRERVNRRGRRDR
jgi:hypothetical protein